MLNYGYYHIDFVFPLRQKTDSRGESLSFSKQKIFKWVVPSFQSLCYNLFLATVLDRRTNRQRTSQTL